MKKNDNLSVMQVFTGVLFVFALILTSCQNQSSSFEWTKTEKEIAKKEISDAAKLIIKGASAADFELAAKPYLNSPEFLVINPDATFNNYENFEIEGKQFFNQLIAYDQTTLKEEYRFLNKDIVLYTWIGKANIKLKTGDQMRFDSYIGTMLFKKIMGEWKITYAHETASPAIMN